MPIHADTLALTGGALEFLQRRLAARYVVTDIETNAVKHLLPDGSVWWNVLPMVSEHETCPEISDMNRQALDYALAIGICVRHPVHQHLVHIEIDPEA